MSIEGTNRIKTFLIVISGLAVIALTLILLTGSSATNTNLPSAEIPFMSVLGNIKDIILQFLGSLPIPKFW
jgi:hypothetical protein